VGYEDEAELDAALADLDPLEGVEEGLFIRELLPVILEGASGTWPGSTCFHMERLPRLEREAVEIPGGDWAPYL